MRTRVLRLGLISYGIISQSAAMCVSKLLNTNSKISCQNKPIQTITTCIQLQKPVSLAARMELHQPPGGTEGVISCSRGKGLNPLTPVDSHSDH